MSNTTKYFFLKIVMFGGHIDSWDVGVGAMDDGGGIMVTRQVVLQKGYI